MLALSASGREDFVRDWAGLRSLWAIYSQANQGGEVMSSVYVASAWSDHRRARDAMAALRLRGVETSSDWTKHVDAYPNGDAPEDVLRQHALEDLDGVDAADAVLVLTPRDGVVARGAWSEAGMAIAFGKPVVFAGEQRDKNVFSRLAFARCESDSEAIEATIQALASVRFEESRL